jgi:hypothetical protein
LEVYLVRSREVWPPCLYISDAFQLSEYVDPLHRGTADLLHCLTTSLPPSMSSPQQTPAPTHTRESRRVSPQTFQTRGVLTRFMRVERCPQHSASPSPLSGSHQARGDAPNAPDAPIVPVPVPIASNDPADADADADAPIAACDMTREQQQAAAGSSAAGRTRARRTSSRPDTNANTTTTTTNANANTNTNTNTPPLER